MVPGLFNESPLRNVLIPNEIRQALMEKYRSAGSESVEDLQAEFEKIQAHFSGGKHYGAGAPTGHWRPQHRRSISNMPNAGFYSVPLKMSQTATDGFNQNTSSP